MGRVSRNRKTVDNIYSDYIIDKYDAAYKVDKLNTSPGGINWGFGVEHEAQLFHISKNEPYSFKIQILYLIHKNQLVI